MRKALLVLTVLACLTALGAGMAAACGGGASACCATKSAAASAALVPLNALPAPAVAAIPFSVMAAVPATMERQPLVSGLMQFIDPETGTITGPITQLLAPTDMGTVEPDLSSLPQVQLANGSWMMDTRGVLFDNFVMHIDALGRRTFGCTTDKRVVTAPAPIVVSPYAER